MFKRLFSEKFPGIPVVSQTPRKPPVKAKSPFSKKSKATPSKRQYKDEEEEDDEEEEEEEEEDEEESDSDGVSRKRKRGNGNGRRKSPREDPIRKVRCFTTFTEAVSKLFIF